MKDIKTVGNHPILYEWFKSVDEDQISLKVDEVSSHKLTSLEWDIASESPTTWDIRKKNHFMTLAKKYSIYFKAL